MRPGARPGARACDERAALAPAARPADRAELGVTGLLAVELFERTRGELVVNELAMRPHNSGHWTIEGARTSQFEQHLRAVLDYPLGATTPTAPAVVMANVLGAAQALAMSTDERLHHLFARFPDAKVHLYGKAERPARKVGHVTVLGDDMAKVRARAALAAGGCPRRPGPTAGRSTPVAPGRSRVAPLRLDRTAPPRRGGRSCR